MKLGFYLHRKSNAVYEVVHIAKNSIDDEGSIVVYRNVKTRKFYTRPVQDFIAHVDIRGEIGPRFVLQQELDTPTQIFVETLRMNRTEYLRMAQENPLFIQNRTNQSFKYMLGDKIAFAQATHLISTKCANVLIEWLNKWSDKPSNNDEARRVLGLNRQEFLDYLGNRDNEN